MQPALPSTEKYSEDQVLERTELAPGIYLVRYRQWKPVKHHTNDLIPDPVIPPDSHRRKYPVPEWHTEAACVGMQDEIFFGTEDRQIRPTFSRAGLALAQSICEQCPVRRDCLVHALTQPEAYGVWGGTSGRMREEMLGRVSTGASISSVADEYLEND